MFSIELFADIQSFLVWPSVTAINIFNFFAIAPKVVKLTVMVCKQYRLTQLTCIIDASKKDVFFVINRPLYNFL